MNGTGESVSSPNGGITMSSTESREPSALTPGSIASASDGGGGELISFPPEVQSAIAQILPSSDPLDDPDFSPVDYINRLFPTEQSLSGLDDAMADMRYRVQCVDDDIRRVVRAQTGAGGDAAHALADAQAAILQLFAQIRDIKQKAGESEAMVRDITRDIKQLDTAKKNLTAAITTLNHLHMLVGGVTQLQGLAKQRQYGDAAMLLQGLMEVLEHFKNFTEIPQIKELSDQVQDTRTVLGKQITQDFQSALGDQGGGNKTFVPTKQLAEACLVVDVLEPRVKKALLRWLIARELTEYGIIFADGEEGTWLDKIDNRYNWLKRHLIEFEERLGPMFPPDWEMSERITVEFCDVTRRQLEKTMFKRRLEIDTKLLLHAIQRTSNFELLLGKRFLGVTLDQSEDRKPQEENSSEGTNPFEEEEEGVDDPDNPFFEGDQASGEGQVESQKPTTAAPPASASSGNKFAGIISQCFEPYLSVYIESQDRNLTDLVERAAAEQRERGCAGMAAEGSAVLHSCGDLFMFYKKCLVQCAQLSSSSSSGAQLVSLASVFKKHLRDYASKVLVANLPKASTASSSAAASLTTSMTTITRELKDFSTAGLLQNFQSLLKEGDPVRLSDDEKVQVCTFLVTSEYCLETTQQLESKLKEKCSAPAQSEQVSLSAEHDVFNGVISSCIQLLAQDLESTCEASLAAMTKMPWAQVEAVGDQSAYVTNLAAHMKHSVPLIRDNLVNSRKYFTQFCVRFVNAFIPKFTAQVFRCKPISTVGAEQLLLDAHSIKTLLLDLPTIGSGVSKPSSASAAARKAPPSFTKVVVKGMTRVEMTLKVVMSSDMPNEQFVEQYVKLVPDAELPEFQKVLDMRGVRKVDQAPYIELFRAKATHQTAGSAGATAAAVAAPAATAGRHSQAEESRIKKLENLIKKRL